MQYDAGLVNVFSTQSNHHDYNQGCYWCLNISSEAGDDNPNLELQRHYSNLSYRGIPRTQKYCSNFFRRSTASVLY